MRLQSVIGVFSALCIVPVAGNAATQYLQYIVQNPAEASGDYFGVSVDISGTMGIVGATANDDGGGNAGAAFVFDTASGEFLYELRNPTPRRSDLYGGSVAITSSYAVVGARQDDTYATNGGAVYVYDTETGDLLRELMNPNPENSDGFGVAMSVFGTTAAVGAYRDNDGARSAGSVHIYDLTTGALAQTLNNPNPVVGDQFGISVSVSGNIAVVGANRTDVATETGMDRSVGTAYVFNIETGKLLHTLENPTPDRGDQFGEAVGTNGSVVVISSIRDDEDARNTGKVFVFDVKTGALIRTLDNPTPDSGDYFGNALDVFGDTVLIGAVRDDEGTNNTGAAHLFNLTTGELLQTLANPAPKSGDLFGGALAIYDGNILIGSSKDDTLARDSGAAYFFSDAVPIVEEPAGVPLPATAPMLLFGMMAIGGFCRRRRG